METNTQRAYDRYCRGRFEPATAEQVDSLEAKINVTFPLHYRQYLLEWNGGWLTEPQIVSDDESAPDDWLTYMHGINAPENIAELGCKVDLALLEDNDPPLVVPIGRTIRNYLIMLVTDPAGDDYGDVLLRSFTEWFYLASDMDEFFGLLRDPDPE